MERYTTQIQALEAASAAHLCAAKVYEQYGMWGSAEELQWKSYYCLQEVAELRQRVVDAQAAAWNIAGEY